jgi:hypothetical protein
MILVGGFGSSLYLWNKLQAWCNSNGGIDLITTTISPYATFSDRLGALLISYFAGGQPSPAERRYVVLMVLWFTRRSAADTMAPPTIENFETVSIVSV